MSTRFLLCLFILLALMTVTGCGPAPEEVQGPESETVSELSQPGTATPQLADEQTASPEAEQAGQEVGPLAVVAESRKNEVAVVSDQVEEPLPAPTSKRLNTGDGITVNLEGRALLLFENLLMLEVIRDGELIVQEASPEDRPIILSVRQNGGTIFNNFSIDQNVESLVEREEEQVTIIVETPQARNRIQWSVRSILDRLGIGYSGAAKGLAAPAAPLASSMGREIILQPAQVTESELLDQGWTISLESYTPLEWYMVSEDAVSMVVETSEAETTVANNVAHWVADETIGPAVPYKRDAVARWFERSFAGEPTFEIGDVLWDPADVVAITGEIESLPVLDQDKPSFMLGGVEMILGNGDSASAYTLSDCNNDGIDDLVIQQGTVKFNFRPLLNRVRSVDVQLFGVNGTREVRPLNPAEEIIAQEADTLSIREHELLSVRSDPNRFEEPYHFLELTVDDGCFLGFSLTPPLDNLEPAPPRWPLPPEEEEEVAVVTQTPTATSTPCVVTACPAGWASYRVRSGDTLWGLAERTQVFSPGLTVEEIKEANCIASDSDILPMDAIVCVPAPPTATPTLTPTPTSVSVSPLKPCPPLSLDVEEETVEGQDGVAALREGREVVSGYRISLTLTVNGGCPPYSLTAPDYSGDIDVTATADIPHKTIDLPVGENTLDGVGVYVCPPPSHDFTATDARGSEAQATYQAACGVIEESDDPQVDIKVQGTPEPSETPQQGE